MRPLNSDQIRQFIEAGFVRLDNAFSGDLAVRGRQILWKDTGCDPVDPTTWTKPVVWLGEYDQDPFCRAANMPVLRAAFDQLVGKTRWQPQAQPRQFSGAVSEFREDRGYGLARRRELSRRPFRSQQFPDLAYQSALARARIADAFSFF
jgi:hypothetical protein